MKYFYLFIILISLSLSAFAQSKGTITGKIIDATTKQPVDYATISIYKAGSASPFNGASSDNRGSFKVNNIADGTYKVTVDFLGYQRQTIDNVKIANGANTALGTLILSAAQTTLKDVSQLKPR
jgi:ferric enterobactin receptor